MFFKRTSSKPVGTPVPAPKRYPETSRTQTSHGNSPYRPLRQDVDSIRLIRIHPAKKDTDSIICDLIEAPLGERPQYEALSYTWGEQREKKTIVLNGFKFPVGPNLFDALQCLRRRGDGKLFWIDAICIHQTNNSERNKQLRVMNHIYFRATTVVVWLGQKYVRHQTQMSKARSPSDKQESERQMARDLIADNYWSRVWIIQEIGRATQLQVCFGNHAMTWEAFIGFVKSYSRQEQGPLRLARQVDRKYAGSHRLRELLYTHRHALCKERVDKIYGLVGFAFDAAEFPIDYNKAPVEVWVDTIEYMNRHNLFEKPDRELDIAFYGSLLKFLLLGSEPSHIEQNAQAHVINRGSSVVKIAWNSPINPRIFQADGQGMDELKRGYQTSSRAPAGSNQAAFRDNWAQKNQYKDSPMRVR